LKPSRIQIGGLVESTSAGAAIWAGGGRIPAIEAPRLEIPSLTPDGGSFASAVEVYVHVPPLASFLAYTIGASAPPPVCTADDELSARLERTKEGSGQNLTILICPISGLHFPIDATSTLINYCHLVCYMYWCQKECGVGMWRRVW
jgi:hypothetical protein